MQHFESETIDPMTARDQIIYAQINAISALNFKLTVFQHRISLLESKMATSLGLIDTPCPSHFVGKHVPTDVNLFSSLGVENARLNAATTGHIKLFESQKVAPEKELSEQQCFLAAVDAQEVVTVTDDQGESSTAKLNEVDAELGKEPYKRKSPDTGLQQMTTEFINGGPVPHAIGVILSDHKAKLNDLKEQLAAAENRLKEESEKCAQMMLEFEREKTEWAAKEIGYQAELETARKEVLSMCATLTKEQMQMEPLEKRGHFLDKNAQALRTPAASTLAYAVNEATSWSQCPKCSVALSSQEALEAHHWVCQVDNTHGSVLVPAKLEEYSKPCGQMRLPRKVLPGIKVKRYRGRPKIAPGHQGYPCTLCLTMHASRSLLQQHIATSHRPVSFVCCHHCRRKFKHVGYLRAHLAKSACKPPQQQRHHLLKEGVFSCSQCKRQFVSRRGLLIHRAQCKLKSQSVVIEDTSQLEHDFIAGSNSQMDFFRCIKCLAVFENRRRLAYHLAGTNCSASGPQSTDAVLTNTDKARTTGAERISETVSEICSKVLNTLDTAGEDTTFIVAEAAAAEQPDSMTVDCALAEATVEHGLILQPTLTSNLEACAIMQNDSERPFRKRSRNPSSAPASRSKDLFFCLRCPQVFAMKADLDRHVARNICDAYHSEGFPYEYDKCQFSNQNMYRGRLTQCHGPSSVLSAAMERSGAKGTQQTNLGVGVKAGVVDESLQDGEQSLDVPPRSGRKRMSNRRFLSPITPADVQSPGEFPCKRCPMKFTRLESLQRHIARNICETHRNRRFSCAKCKGFISLVHGHNGHVCRHSGANIDRRHSRTNVPCQICGLSLQVRSLKHHLEAAHGKRRCAATQYLMCPVCRSSVSRQNLSRHIRTQHRTTASEITKSVGGNILAPATTQKLTNVAMEPTSDEVFASDNREIKNLLAWTIKNAHKTSGSRLRVRRSQQLLLSSVDDGGQTPGNDSRLTYHPPKSVRSRACVAGQKIDAVNTLVAPVDGELLRCSLCQMVMLANQWNQHMLRMHCVGTAANQTAASSVVDESNLLPVSYWLLPSGRYRCGRCLREYGNLRTLKRHQTPKSSNVLVKPKVHACPLCDKACDTIKLLRTHISKQHSNERRYYCFRCPKAYRHVHDLVIHLKKCGTSGGESSSSGDQSTPAEQISQLDQEEPEEAPGSVSFEEEIRPRAWSVDIHIDNRKTGVDSQNEAGCISGDEEEDDDEASGASPTKHARRCQSV